MTLRSLLVAALLTMTAMAIAPGASAQVVSITNVAPSEGTTNGGTLVTLTGTGFQAGALVLFGGVQAENITATATSITANTPARAFASTGPVAIEVRNPGGSGTIFTGGFTYTASSTPTISSVSPSSGPTNGGTSFVITGTNFVPGLDVMLDTAPATIVSTSSTTIVAVSNAHGVGTVDVHVMNPDGRTATRLNGWGYTAAPTPTLTGVSPNSGSINGGTTVTLTGTGFAPGALVTFDGADAFSVVFVSSTTLQATTPSNAASTTSVRVTNPDGVATTAGTQFYTFVSSSAPTVTAVAPKNGTIQGGTPVTITGTNFHVPANAIPTVTIGGLAATDVVVVSATQITAVTPAHAAGPVDVVVANPGGSPGTLASSFTYVSFTEMPLPTLASVGPTSGTTNGGIVLTITGTGFQVSSDLPTVTIGGANAVVCTGTDAPIVGCSAPTSTALNVVVPAKSSNTAAANQKVKVTNVDGRSVESDATDNSDDFDYTVVALIPTITSVAPTSGTTNGAVITITGTNFFVAGNPVLLPKVTVGGTTAVVCTGAAAPRAGCAAPTATSLTVIAPGKTATGIANVEVTNPNGVKNAAPGTATDDDFNYATNDAAPTLVSATPGGPATARGGFNVALVGTGFATAGPKPTVTVGGVVLPDSDVTVTTSSTMTVLAPAHAVGAVSVIVKNPDGDSVTLANAFTYVAGGAPTLSSINPATGPVTGGATITLTGTNFPLSEAAKPTLTVGGTTVPAANILSVTGTSIEFKLPVRTTPGSVTIVVANPDGQAASLGNSFRYIPTPPTLKTVAPTSGPATGGTEITLTGTFSTFGGGPTAVFFGDLPGTDVTVTTTSIKVKTPGIANAPMTVDVTVIDLYGQAIVLPDAFTFNTALPPSFTSLAPALVSLNGGATVTVTGNGFGNVAAVGVGSGLTFVEAAGVITASATSLTFTMPNFAHPDGTMRLGPVDLVVVNGDGQELELLGRIAYSTATGPVINSVAPTTGPAAGGTAITISGANFASSSTVTVGGTACTAVVVVSPTSITCTTPAGSGAAAVVVTSLGQSASLAGGFTYAGSSSGGGENPPPPPPPPTTTPPPTTSSSTSGSPVTPPTAAQIEAANLRVEVTVTREGETNVVSWTLPTSGLPATPTGVQVWASNSPYSLLQTCSSSTACFTSSEFTHTGSEAKATTNYLVTMFYGPSEALGLFTASTAPDTADYSGVSSQDSSDGNDGLPWWAITLIVVGILFLVVLVAILIARGRNRSGETQQTATQGYAWEESKAAEAEWEGDGPEVHQARCPACATSFTATGAKPIVTVCPGCGKKGILR